MEPHSFHHIVHTTPYLFIFYQLFFIIKTITRKSVLLSHLVEVVFPFFSLFLGHETLTTDTMLREGENIKIDEQIIEENKIPTCIDFYAVNGKIIKDISNFCCCFSK